METRTMSEEASSLSFLLGVFSLKTSSLTHKRTTLWTHIYSTTSTRKVKQPNMSNILPLHHSAYYPTRQSSLSRSASSVQTSPASSSTATIRPQPKTQLQAPLQVRGQSIAMSGNPSSGPGLRYPSNKKTIYDRNLNRSKNAELSRAAFAYLFIEMIAYAQKGAKDVGDLEQRYARI
jgi:hypothetical protein